MIKNVPFYQVFVISLFLTFIFYLKYFLQGWDAVGIDLNQNISNVIIAIGLLFGFISLLISNNKERLIFIVLLLFFIANLVLNNNKNLFWAISAFPFFVYMSRIQFDKVVSVFFACIVLTWLIFIPVLSFFSESMVFLDDRYIRLTFGFANPNTFAALLFVTYTLCLMYVDLKCSKFGVSIFVYVIVSLLLLPVLYSTMSRTFLFSSLLIAFYFPLRKLRFLRVKVWHARLSILLICVLQLFLTFNYSPANSWMFLLNSIFSGRVRLANEMYNSLGYPNLFLGQDITDYIPIDFFFTNFLYSSGWLFSLLFILFYFILLSGIRLMNNFSAFICLSFILLSLSENLFNIPVINFSMFILYCAYLKNSKERIG
ncbi:hypothetical protein [Escherichia coli]|uniref:hypothetical protein n=1 Tax=Escherichia coli TaxID=562 RepID=UPI0009266F34|nr:hypothetical protein [Escherichia coli]EFE7783042.1 hypothetical protein [Escherichia coli]EJE0231373.1 hypothetical protein [Escherichia coli]MBY7340898.1 hypothetical protein [Escherichia coli]MBY7464681.1 hypothetical protein [Escherichia coli]MBY7598365.1 hypothetical protein [Escherichia coli]